MHALVTGQESRQQLYIMLTRGRRANHLYSTTGDLHRHFERSAEHDLDDIPDNRAHQPQEGAHAALLRCLRRSARQRLARQHAPRPINPE